MKRLLNRPTNAQDINDVNWDGSGGGVSPFNYLNVPISNILTGDYPSVPDFSDTGFSSYIIDTYANIFINTWKDCLQSAINFPEEE